MADSLQADETSTEPGDSHPAETMERLYVRRDRNFTSLLQVRCPECGRIAQHRKKAHLPKCYGKSTNARAPGSRGW